MHRPRMPKFIAPITESRFGIEIETCVHDLKRKDILEPLDRFLTYYTSKLNTLSKALDIEADFEFKDDPHDGTDYTKWTITTDDSVGCSDSSVKKDSDHVDFIGKRVKSVKLMKSVKSVKSVKFTRREKSAKFKELYGFEIVSPIIPFNVMGLEFFSNVHTHVIMNKSFIYEVHTSQGLHINISHPQQDKVKFLQWWWYFEPLILLFVPVNRRNSIYARPVRQVFVNYQDITAANIAEYYALPDEPPAKYTAVCVKDNRFEIRLIESSMDLQYIINWTWFLISFLHTSITSLPPHETTIQSAHIENILFDQFLHNSVLKKAFLTRT